MNVGLSKWEGGIYEEPWRLQYILLQLFPARNFQKNVNTSELI